MGAYGTFLAVLGSIWLDHPTFKLPHKLCNEIITFLAGAGLDNFMPTYLRLENMRITALRDPEGCFDHVTLKELPLWMRCAWFDLGFRPLRRSRI